MDLVQDWAAHFLNAFNEDETSTSSFLRSILTSLTSRAVLAWYNTILPLTQQIFTTKPDLASIALLLIIVLVSLKILDILWQTLVAWLRLARRIVLYGGLVALGLWVYTRGPDGVADDVQYWTDTWGREYQYWKDQEASARLLRQATGGSTGGKGSRAAAGGSRSWF